MIVLYSSDEMAIGGILCILFDSVKKTIAISFQLLLPYAGYSKHRRFFFLEMTT